MQNRKLYGQKIEVTKQWKRRGIGKYGVVCFCFLWGDGNVLDGDSGEGCTKLQMYQNHPRSKISPSSHFRCGSWLWPHLQDPSPSTPSSCSSTKHSKSTSQASSTLTHSFHSSCTAFLPSHIPWGRLGTQHAPQTLPCPTLSTGSLLTSSKNLS